MKASRQLPGSAQTSFGERLRMDLSRHWPLYLMVLPAVVVIAVFSYAPMYGVVIAFKNFKPAYGISGSSWVGLRNFERFFSSYQFKNTLLNTLSISIYSMLACFPAPVILALMMDQVRSKSTQRFIQTVTYMPHFISVIVVSGMILTFLNVNTGLYGNLARLLGDEAFEALFAEIPASDSGKLELTSVNEPYGNANTLPSLKFTEEESDELSIVKNDVDTYVNKKIVEWFANGGVEDEWESYLNELNNMGVETYVSIYQEAYNRQK